MENLNYVIKINAKKEKVWDSMLDKDKYNQWTKAFSKNSTFIGNWEQGSKIKFIDSDLGGTLAILEIVDKYKHILIKHIATLTKEEEIDTSSKMAESWIGTTEEYILKEEEDITTLKIEIQTHEDYIKMFEESWPKALENLKEICET